jgi:ABC-type glycerol-3-phosphate transport system substrate-binding protein
MAKVGNRVTSAIKVAGLLGSFAALLPLSGALAAGSAITGTITVLSNRTDMQANGMLAKYSQEFEKLYPGTTVKWQTFVDNSTVQAQMSGGVYPDVMLILPNITKPELSTYFAPLNSLGLDHKVYFANFNEYKGKVYGLPSFGDVNGIVYNKAAFKKAGITHVPTTLNALYKDMALLKKAGIVPMALNYTAKWPLANWSNVLPDLIAQNANWENTMVHSNAPFSPNTPMGKALTIVYNIVHHGWAEPQPLNTNWNTSKPMLAQGKFAMMFLGNWAVPQIIGAGAPSKDIGFFPFPTSNSGKNIAIAGPDWMYAVNKHSAHLATAMAFVKWMIEDSGYANYAGGLPPLKSQKSSVPQIAQFERDASKILTALPGSTTWTKIANAAQLDLTGGGAVQPLFTSSNLDATLQQMNQAWASARSLLGLASK